jgi:hypothetical protein
MLSGKRGVLDMGQQQDQSANERNYEPTLLGPKDRLVSIGWHWSYGILRRSECDHEDGYRGFCYEFPNGLLKIYSQRDDHEIQCFFNEWVDPDTGEKYLTLDPRPTDFLVKEYGSKTVPGRLRI